MKTWTSSNVNDATDKYLGYIEFQSNDEEFHLFELMETNDRIVFGGACNVGFIESGYIDKDECLSTDEILQEILADLEVYYNDGKDFCSHIVCTERM